jgi:hypothetical protein
MEFRGRQRLGGFSSAHKTTEAGITPTYVGVLLSEDLPMEPKRSMLHAIASGQFSGGEVRFWPTFQRAEAAARSWIKR